MLQQTQLWQKLILQSKKEASNIYPKQTTNEEKLPKLTSICFSLILITFESFAGTSLTFSNNQEI